MNSKELGNECNKLFEMIKNVQNVLDDTYIRHLKRTQNNSNFYINQQDLDRSDLGSLKSPIMKLLKECHVEELVNNGMKFEDEESKVLKDMEEKFPPEIPTRSKIE